MSKDVDAAPDLGKLALRRDGVRSTVDAGELGRSVYRYALALFIGAVLARRDWIACISSSEKPASWREAVHDDGRPPYLESCQLLQVGTDLHDIPFVDVNVVLMRTVSDQSDFRDNVSSPENSKVMRSLRPPGFVKANDSPQPQQCG